MGKRNKTAFDVLLKGNMRAYNFYSYRLLEMALSSFEWSGFPETIDSRYLESTFYDDSVSGAATITVSRSGLVTSVTVSPATATVATGGTKQMTATVATAKPWVPDTVTWTSSNAKVTVSDAGLVTVAADATGTATITATSTYDSSVTGTATITVGS